MRPVRRPTPAAPNTCRRVAVDADAPLGHPHRRQPRPAGAVGRRGDRARAHRDVATGREDHLAVDDRGQHVDGDVAFVDRAASAASGRGASVGVGIGGAPRADRAPCTTCFEVAAAVGHRQQPVGHGQPRRAVRARAYQSTIAGSAVQIGLNIQAAQPNSRGACDTAAGPQQPAVQPLLFGARPGQRRGVLERADLRRPHRRCGQRPHRDHIVGRDLHHRTGLGAIRARRDVADGR